MITNNLRLALLFEWKDTYDILIGGYKLSEKDTAHYHNLPLINPWRNATLYVVPSGLMTPSTTYKGQSDQIF